jgi:hypothetical protein
MNEKFEIGSYAYIQADPSRKVKITGKVEYDPKLTHRGTRKKLTFPHYRCYRITDNGKLDAKAMVLPMISLSSRAINR